MECNDSSSHADSAASITTVNLGHAADPLTILSRASLARLPLNTKIHSQLSNDASDLEIRSLKVLACHNYYQQPGGEDECFHIETNLLESEGHEVVRYTRHNDDIMRMNRMRVAKNTIWNRRTYAEIRDLIQRERPDVMHCTNTFPLISPAAYYAAQREGVPVVQSLHNYRLICANGQFLRDGKTCEKCLSKATPWPAVYHACYRDSVLGSAVVAGMLTYHRISRTYQEHVNVFVALTEFARSKFIEAGIPAHKISVNPNFLTINPEPGSGSGGYAVFVGRLSPEKGIDILLETWAQPTSRSS